MGFRLHKQIVPAILSFILLFSALGSNERAYAVETEAASTATVKKSDIDGHWAETVMQKWAALELIKGYAGAYKPNANITRAEFVAILSRVLNLPRMEAALPFKDVSADSWFYSDVASAFQYGLISGRSADSFVPGAAITRQDAAVIVARAFQLSGAHEHAAAVKDRLQIADYALAAVDALFAKRYVQGRGDETFAPLGLLTRGEAVQLIDRVMGTWVTDASALQSPIRGNLLVSKSDTRLQGLVIEGDLYIVQGVGEGGILLDGITVKGNTYVLGGGEAIEIRSSTLAGPLVVNKKAGGVHIIASGDTTVSSVMMESGGVLEEKDLKSGVPGFQSVTANSGNPSERGKVVLIGTFDKVIGAKAGSGLELAEGTVVDRLIVDAPIVVDGKGTVKLASFQKSGSVFGKWPEKAEFKPGVTATINSKLVDKDDRGSTPGGGDSGGVVPSPSPSPSQGIDDTDFIVASGAANADIVLSPQATEMEQLAASELRDTLQMISGAELPIYTQDHADGEVSAQLMRHTLAVKRSGEYPVEIALNNSSEQAVVLDGVATAEQGITLTWPMGIRIEANSYLIVSGTVHIPDELDNGTYSLEVQFTVDSSVLRGYPLQVKLDREYLSNGDFEQRTTSLPYPDSWIFDEGVVVWDDQAAASGRHSMKLQPGSADWIFFRANHDIKPESGKHYVLNAQVKNPSHAGKATMLIREVLKDGTDKWFAKELAPSSDWSLQSLHYTPSANVRDIWTYFEISEDKDEPVWIDGVSLTETDPLPITASLPQGTLNVANSGPHTYTLQLVNHTAETVQTVVSTTADAPIQTMLPTPVAIAPQESTSVKGTIQIPADIEDGTYQVRIQTGSGKGVWENLVLNVKVNRNLLYNADFELKASDKEAPDGWNWYGDDAVWDSTEHHSGDYSVKVGPKPSGWVWAVSTVRTAVHEGAQYQLSAWVKNPSTQGQNQMIVAEQLPGGGDSLIYVDLPQTTEWTRVEYEYTPSPGISEVLIAFKSDSGEPAADQPLWVDHVNFRENAMDTDLAPPEDDAEQTFSLPEPLAEDPSAVPVLTALEVGSLHDLKLVVGTFDSIPAIGTLFPEDAANLKDSDGFAVRRLGDNVYIFGSEPKGTLNGVYDFLEENAGILWTRSKEIGNLYEEQETIALTKADYTEKSPFQLRGWHTTGYGAEGEEHADYGTEVMLARNKMNAKLAEIDFNRATWPRQQRFGIQSYVLGHNLYYWLSPNVSLDSLLQTHPEYFNLDDDGEPYYGTNAQFNFFNEEVADIVADNMAYFLADNPVDYIGIGINDTRQFNQGELTKTSFEYASGQFVDPSDPAFKSTVYFTFLNKVARKLKVTHPGVKLTTFAYFFTEVPPKVALEDNIHVLFAPIDEDARTPLNTNDPTNPNAYYNEMLQGWADKTNNIAIYNYYGSFVSDAYERPIAEKVQADLQYYRDLGIEGVLPEGIVDANGPQWGVNALQFWLFGKLFWNPDADLEQLKSEFIQKAYGKAADAMRTYYDLIEEGWNADQMPIHFSTGKKTLVRQYILNPGIKDAAQAALDTAYALADTKQKARIAPIKTAFEELTALVEGITETSGTAVKTTASKDEILNALDFSQGPWTEAIPLTNFLTMNTMGAAPAETKVRLLWDDEYLYVGYENFDTDLSKREISDSAPKEWWAGGYDDSVETYLTGDMTGTKSYYAYFTNPLSINLDFEGFPVDASYTAAWSGKAADQSDRWNVVQAIPFAAFGVDPQITSQIKGHFMRNYHLLSGGDYISWTGSAVWKAGDLSIINLIDPANP